jgi:anti-anti-sigma factor
MTEAFALQESQVEGCFTLCLSGELDVASAASLERRVMKLCHGNALEIALDMGELSFIDSSGLNAILRLKAACEEHGCRFYLTPGPPPVHRLFHITRLRDRLSFRKSSRD